jgi:hypothetical protein
MSCDPLTMRFPSEEKAIEFTSPECPHIVHTCRPFLDQTIFNTKNPRNTRKTHPAPYSPHRTQSRVQLTSIPVSAFQIFTRWSSDALTTRAPSGEKATDFRQREWPVTGHSRFLTCPDMSRCMVHMQSPLQSCVLEVHICTARQRQRP